MPHITEKMLIQHLKQLEGDRLLIREARPVVPPYVTYTLTEGGRELESVINAMAEWAYKDMKRSSLPVAAEKWRCESRAKFLGTFVLPADILLSFRVLFCIEKEAVMKVHTTNFENTFIEVADDCPATGGEIPPMKGDAKTVAGIQYEMISRNPYKFTSDDVLFKVFAERKDLTESELGRSPETVFLKRPGMYAGLAADETIRLGHSQRSGRKNRVVCL